jgi:phosphate-selective porin OprO/OprP
MAFVSTESFAQKKEPKIKMFFGRGLQFVAGDSLFTLAINGRIQVMFESNSNLTNKTTQNEFLLRRCRLNIQGIAFTPRLFYRIQLGFASTDMASSNKAEANNLVLRDAMLYYQATKWLRIGAGQTKLPGNRQRQVSSANLQLVERAIANNNFTLDRDKGIWIFTNFNIKTCPRQNYPSP